MRDQVPHALREFDDFDIAAEFEIDLIIVRRSVIYSFSEFKQRLHHLAQ